jgi:hypothetical protein
VCGITTAVPLYDPLKQEARSEIATNPCPKDANLDNIFVDYGDLDNVASAVEIAAAQTRLTEVRATSSTLPRDDGQRRLGSSLLPR